ncbi:hypothetical protein BW14_06015 [Bifidobacterium sp. UTBIF-68]|uniref:hypothetical protein n=1 Tax=Bifidobacterium sp. UTBIF-68 TaxID=1465262 RepID=UPI00112B9182|nr:hypothetical protein [Bifidobacterium sp. UTBIF-68]TPF93229.1 hypothetical protein BW14_06015 [Bifidobacterium sp. UTBIF-68]
MIRKYHRISRCPECGGRIRPKWEFIGHLYASPFWQLVFQCARCDSRWLLDWDFEPRKDDALRYGIRRWNAYRNGGRRRIVRLTRRHVKTWNDTSKEGTDHGHHRP